MANLNAELRTYLLVFLALLVLVGVTVGAALLDLGPFGPIVALLIAGLKAGLIMVFFMHLRHTTKVAWVFAALGLLWLSIMLGLTMADYLTRG
jgi:cytochrome c oxidase subunit IV